MNRWSSWWIGRQIARKKEKATRRESTHPFVLIANHQLSEKRSAPKIPTSILTSRRVARARNFTSRPRPGSLHRSIHGYVFRIYLSSCFIVHPVRPIRPPISLQNDRVRVRTRARPYQLVHTWALGVSEPFEMLLGAPVEMYGINAPSQTVENLVDLWRNYLYSSPARRLILERIEIFYTNRDILYRDI